MVDGSFGVPSNFEPTRLVIALAAGLSACWFLHANITSVLSHLAYLNIVYTLILNFAAAGR